MRIVAGKHRGRRLALPQDARIRPTADRVRESLFNVLAHGDFSGDGTSPIAGAVVLDAFCGTGALGLEALSRGAARAIFLDQDEHALALVRASLDALKERARARLVRSDATRLPLPPEPATLAFLDPPYGEGLAAAALKELAARGWLAPGALVCVETGPRDALEPPAGFAELDRRAWGKARVTMLRFAGAQAPA